MTFALPLSNRLLTLVGTLSLVALMTALPSRASAQACATNADCPAGTTCQTNSTPGADPTRGGTAGTAGSSGAAGTAIVAPDAVSKACAPAPCKVDSDCGGQMVCHTETVSSCSGGTAPPCARDTKCDPVVPPTCTETKVSACAYKWQLPCSADADCGSGFACEPNVISTCSGGGPVTGGGTAPGATDSTGVPTPNTGGSSGTAAPSDLPARVAPSADGGTGPMCTTMTSFPGWCRAKATTCTTDADCPAPWTCVDGTPAGGTTTDVGTGSSGSGTGSGGVAQPAVDGGAAPPPETIVARVKVCQSPAAFPARGSYATDSGSKGPPSGGGTTLGPGNGAPETAKTSNAGCSVAGAGATAPFASLAGLLLGLAVVFGRRRR